MQKIQDRRVNSKYSLVCKLGEGGFGAVYLGMHTANYHGVWLSDHFKERILTLAKKSH